MRISSDENVGNSSKLMFSLTSHPGTSWKKSNVLVGGDGKETKQSSGSISLSPSSGFRRRGIIAITIGNMFLFINCLGSPKVVKLKHRHQKFRVEIKLIFSRITHTYIISILKTNLLFRRPSIILSGGGGFLSRESGIFVTSNGFLKYLNLEGWKFQWYSGGGVSAADGVRYSSLSVKEGSRVGGGEGAGRGGVDSLVSETPDCRSVLDGERPRILKCCSFQE